MLALVLPSPSFMRTRLRLGGGRYAFEEVLAHAEHRIYLAEVVGDEYAVYAAVNLGHVVVDVHQVGRLLARKALVVIVDVFERGARYVHQRLGYFAQVVDHLNIV